MTTWTPKTKQGETWTSEANTGQGVFSRFVFSHASYTGKFVFAFRNQASDYEGWHNAIKQSETWTAR